MKRKIRVLVRFEDCLNDCENEMHASEADILHCVQAILDEGFIITAIEEIEK